MAIDYLLLLKNAVLNNHRVCLLYTFPNICWEVLTKNEDWARGIDNKNFVSYLLDSPPNML